ncbi:MAG: glycosyltransferase family 9 protein [Alphaproteobacteria bacterium]
MPAPVLFIAPTRIGDAVLATSLLEHIHQRHPEARVTIVASPFSAPLFEAYPALATLHVIDKQTYGRHWWRIWKMAVRTRWSAVWDLRGSALAYLCVTRRRHVFRGHPKPMPKLDQFQRQLALPSLPCPVLWTTHINEARARALIPDDLRVLVFAPSANWPPKQWPMEHFITLAQQLLKGSYHGYRPMIITAAHERAAAAPLLTALQEFSPIDATDGALTLLDLYACLRRARGFVGNDSGLMHMAAAAGIPTLGLFGPTDALTYQPVGARASQLLAPDGKMTLLSPEKVAEKIISWQGEEK